MFHQHLSEADSSKLSLLLVAAAYLLFFAAYFLIIFKSKKERSYGASLLTIASQLGISVICLIGPALYPALFYRPSPWSPGDSFLSTWGNWLIWLAQTLVWLVIFVQYLRYARTHPTRFPELQRYFHPITWITLLGVTLTMWLFIIFTRDFYINTSWPHATLLMALGYFAILAVRPQLRGLSLAGAWCLTVATGALYLGTTVKGLEWAYPCHAPGCYEVQMAGELPDYCQQTLVPGDSLSVCLEASGYTYIYWVYLLGFLLMLVYSVVLTKRREELASDYDVDKTLDRYGLRPD